MSRTQRFSPTRVALVVGAAAGALALTGCGAGQLAQTSEQTAAVSGANLTSGHIAIRNAEIEFPDVPTRSIAVYRTGGAAPLAMTVANESGEPDRLLSASSPYAGSVRLEGDKILPAHQALVLGGPTLVAPPNAKAVHASLEGLTSDLAAGQNYPVTLVFERAGAITVTMPMGNADNLVAGEVQAPAAPRPGGGH